MQKPFFSSETIVTKLFCHYWQKLTPEQRKVVYKNVLLLVENPRHPGLRAHPTHRCPGIWECYWSNTGRIVYSRWGSSFVLYAVGGHEVVDRVHRLCLQAAKQRGNR